MSLSFSSDEFLSLRFSSEEFLSDGFLSLSLSSEEFLSLSLSSEEFLSLPSWSEEFLSLSLLSEEFLASIADTQMGASNWQEALEKLSEKYAIDSLSDFVLDLINTFNKGASILDSVERQSKDIKKNNLLTMKENASKLSNTILIPILIFKIFPVLALIIIPIIQQLNSTLV